MDGVHHDGGPVPLSPGRHTIDRGTEVVFPAGAAVPHTGRLPVQDGATWATPFGRGEEHGFLRTCSAFVGAMLGAVGLPHILMRFYTNTSGSAARRIARTSAIMIAASLLTRHRVPRHADRALMKLHLPEDDPGPASAADDRRPGPAPRP